ncbi:MAG: DNA polymerase III subunit alpha [Parcubacteria group bacterium CG11_big_fil_rev_8_21_14_0_20_39_22]|nr:MAG: DNA polymerase III subunit alpha [Parcubacteria group bacterium CG11_big_fil_rev_8_21_14_0_20_39_22]
MSDFIHLHTHSHYSLLSGLPKIPELVAAAKNDGQTALALTDNGNLYGTIEFYKECKKQEIKPIIGVDAYIALRTRNDKQAGVDNRRTRLVLLAKDVEGYKNLLKLVTISNMEGFYYKPRMDKEIIEKHSKGLIAISPSFNSDILQALEMADKDKAVAEANWAKKVFGGDSFFIEITRHPEREGHEDKMKKLIEFGREQNIPLVAAHDVYYIDPEDRKARETLTLVNSNRELSDRNSEGENTDFSFISQQKARELFVDLDEALSNTKKIESMCELELPLGKWLFPHYEIEGGKSPDEELKSIVKKGIAKRGIEETEEVKNRVEYELSIIKTKGYAPYFLVVGDLLREAHDRGILTTIRGSVAGSMVTYLAGITNVDPIKYKIPFERFLNPERPSAPDIDMDYADNRRDEMIEYAREKYGRDKVAQIGTFGTMMARGAVRDVARALGHEYSAGDRIAKLIPMGSQGFPMTLKRALEMVSELAEIYKKEPVAKEIIDTAKKIEGSARHVGVHAAGVVISPVTLTDVTPLQFDPKGEGKIITQYDMYSIDENNAGLLKFDFLGIKNLSILADAVKRVEELKGVKIDIENVPLDDKKTFEILASGETIGLFQLNGTGMTKHLKDLKPSKIQDINAMVALYRPGPMESIPQYIERKHNPILVSYLDPRLEKILSDSYGVITYQDDVLMIAIEMAGFSWLEADKLRKAMGKKIPKEMEIQKKKLIKGFIEHNLSPAKAEKLWKLIEPFAAYGFNKAHAASYGKVAYQTAYMKANFPAIYMSAVLTADSGDVEKIGEIISECKRMKIPVLPPDINESFADFTVVPSSLAEGDKIRFGLTTIKNFGEGIAQTIIEERNKDGKFTSLSDFLKRIKDRNLNKKSLEALIKSGALDAFNERGEMIGNIERLLSFNKENAKAPDNQDSLFSGLSAEIEDDIHLEKSDPISKKEILLWEKELLGLYISGHPLDKYKEVLEKRDVNIATIRKEPRDGIVVIIGGIVEEVKNIITKKNEVMAFVKIADLTGSIETVVFPKTYSEYKDMLVLEKCVALKAKVSMRNGEVSLIVEKVKGL